MLVNGTDQGVAGFERTTERVDHEAEIRKRAGVELNREEYERILAKVSGEG